MSVLLIAAVAFVVLVAVGALVGSALVAGAREDAMVEKLRERGFDG